MFLSTWSGCLVAVHHIQFLQKRDCTRDSLKPRMASTSTSMYAASLKSSSINIEYGSSREHFWVEQIPCVLNKFLNSFEARLKIFHLQNNIFFFKDSEKHGKHRRSNISWQIDWRSMQRFSIFLFLFLFIYKALAFHIMLNKATMQPFVYRLFSEEKNLAVTFLQTIHAHYFTVKQLVQATSKVHSQSILYTTKNTEPSHQTDQHTRR